MGAAARILLVPCLGILAASPVDAAGPKTNPGQKTAQWLVNMAQTYAISLETPPTVGDARTMLLWNRAASRIDPTRAEPYRNQHDLLLLLDRPADALHALRSYCQEMHDDPSRCIALMEVDYQAIQTADERIAFCLAQLESDHLAGPLRSEVHRMLAETFLGTGNTTKARQHAEAALREHRFNFAAHQFLLALTPNGPPLEARVQYLLDSIAAAPSQWQTMRDLGQLLKSYGLNAAAAECLGYISSTLAAHGWNDSSWKPPQDLLLEAGQLMLDTSPESVVSALRHLDFIEKNYGDSLSVKIPIYEAAQREGLDEGVQELLEAMRRQVEETLSMPDVGDDPQRTAELARFFLEVDPDPVEALRFAKLAAQHRPDDPAARRLFGLALVANERWADARTALAPLALADPPDMEAAWGLAQALLGLDEVSAALDVMQEATRVVQSGSAHDRIVDLIRDLGAAPLPGPSYQGVKDVLASFNKNVLKFGNHPEHFLKLTMQLTDASPQFGESWQARFVLANQGDFSITVGPGLMIDGQLLLSAKTNLPDAGPFAALLTIPINLQPVIYPGQDVSVTQSLDVGPLADTALRAAQRPIEIEFSVILDPLANSDGGWVSAHGQGLTTSTKLVRQPIKYTKAGVQQLVHDLRGKDSDRRALSVIKAVGLLAERQTAVRDKLDYKPVRVDHRGLNAIIERGIGDADPTVKARSVNALGQLPHKDDRAKLMAPPLSDSHWLVRMLTIDALARNQGDKLKPVLQRLAADDVDPLVREMAELHLERLATSK